MSGIISGLAGAGGAANNAGQYYTNAANHMSRYGLPAACTHLGNAERRLRPQFQSRHQSGWGAGRGPGHYGEWLRPRQPW